jgi:hypothetical protein
VPIAPPCKLHLPSPGILHTELDCAASLAKTYNGQPARLALQATHSTSIIHTEAQASEPWASNNNNQSLLAIPFGIGKSRGPV